MKTKNIELIEKWQNKLENSVSNCYTDSLPQSVEMAIYIERAFYEKEINDEKRADLHKKLDEFVKDFVVRCECKKEIPMTFD